MGDGPQAEQRPDVCAIFIGILEITPKELLDWTQAQETRCPFCSPDYTIKHIIEFLSVAWGNATLAVSRTAAWNTKPHPALLSTMPFHEYLCWQTSEFQEWSAFHLRLDSAILHSSILKNPSVFHTLLWQWCYDTKITLSSCLTEQNCKDDGIVLKASVRMSWNLQKTSSLLQQKCLIFIVTL